MAEERQRDTTRDETWNYLERLEQLAQRRKIRNTLAQREGREAVAKFAEGEDNGE